MLYEELEAEEWRPVVGWEKWYAVSSWGRVARIRSCTGRLLSQPKVLKPVIYNHDYPGFTLSAMRSENKKQIKLLHHLVVEAFDGPTPPDMEINHINAIKSDGNRWNLELVTRRGNYDHARQRGLVAIGADYPRNLTATEVATIRTNSEGLTAEQLGRRFNVSCGHIYSILNRRSWKDPNRSERITKRRPSE